MDTSMIDPIQNVLGIDKKKATVFEWNIANDQILFYDGNVIENQGPYVFEKLFLTAPLVHAEDIPTVIKVKKNIEQGVLYTTDDFRIQDKNGRYNWHRIHSITQYDKHNQTVKAIGLLYNINMEMNMLEKLHFKAERDSLTGLFNRKEMEERIRVYLSEAPEECCALFMIDTDDFKTINDTKGHMLGDMVLTELAAGMKKIMRDDDVIGRIGGDEFAVFMKNIPSRDQALKKAEDLISMFNHLFSNEKRGIQITCSIGIALYPENGVGFETLYNHADQALYQAKKQGKNRYVLYDMKYAYDPGDHEAKTLGTSIDSDSNSVEGQNSLLTEVFKILYRTEDVDLAIKLTLKIIGKRFDVSRAYVFENSDDGRFCSNTHEWCDNGIQPEIENLQNVDYRNLNHYDRLFDNNSVFYCRDVSKLKGAQLELFQSQGIHSTLQVAFWKEKHFAGFIGFDECTGMRLWTQEEVDTLSLISQIMSTFLQRKRALEQSDTMKEQMKTILDSQDSCIYAIDQNTFELLYISPKVKELSPRSQLGEWCYKALFNRDQPCKFCPIHHGGTGEHFGGKNDFSTKMHASSMKWLGNDAYLLSFNNQDIFFEENENNDMHLPAERSIVDCIQWLTSSEYVENSIEYVLRIIQEYYKSDRVYIIEIDEQKEIVKNTYEICAKGVVPQRDLLQNIPLSSITFWMQQFEARGYIKIDSLEELGEGREQEREILRIQEINSLMAIPLYVKEEMKGFLGIDDPKRHKKNFHYLKGLAYFLENEISKNAMSRNLERMSYEDALTGLENRNSYMKYYDDFSIRMPKKIGVVFMDINGLKKLNMSRGHIYGDVIVAHIATVMKQFFPKERKFRFSGDEFLIITEHMEYEHFVEQLDAMEDEFTENGHSIIAIGRTWSDLNSDLALLVAKAEKMMHIYKNNYYQENKAIYTVKVPLLEGLKKSIADKEYLIYLQPQMNLSTKQVDAAEVLVRYRESDGSISVPLKFIPMLETEGLISNIDFFVMEETCRLLDKWNKQAKKSMTLALNFSRITMFEKDFFQRFWKIFHSYDIRSEQLEIEITETQELLNKKQLSSLLKELKNHGFTIALDDFGVGYSSYEFLMMSDFDILKIDKGVTQRFHDANQGEVLMKHIAQLTHDMGIRSCVEGVETQEQLQYISKIGCDYAQGYLIDKPMPVNKFEEKYINEK